MGLHLLLAAALLISSSAAYEDPELLSLRQRAAGYGASQRFNIEEKPHFDAGFGDKNPMALQIVHKKFVGRSRKAEAMVERLKEDEERVKSIGRRIEQARGQNIFGGSKGANGSENPTPADLNGPVLSGLSLGSGEYFVKLGIGTPAKQILMVLDTGSDITWLQCEKCKRCYKQADPLFNPAKSSSFQPIPCGAQACKNLDIHSCKNRRCLYQVAYGDGSFTMGFFSLESFSFSGSSVQNVAFGCGYDNEGLFVGSDGLLGLGGGALSFATQIGANYAQKFSYCLVQRDNGGKASSSLLFGNTAVPKGSVLTPLYKNPNSRLATFYYVGLVGISVGGSLLPIPSSTFKLGASGNGGVIVDSGTAVTRLPASAYGLIRGAFRAGSQGLQAAPRFSLFDTCFNLSQVKSVDVPTVALHFQGNADVVLPPSNYLVGVDNFGTYCFAFASSSMDLSIIGNIQQQSIRVSVDAHNSQVGFALRQC